ncbi:hypothetical protein [Marinobacterium stanieri]|uniref:Uncharacterized protein n=1 Tax=Marinobacterium stanieri TaxID=49186 RepID=A0A1N6XB97_9GAMM|nr:hypothetical protein [Marinobacterium stanieri]SIQ99509.1 hypothetical protein SAMN05421647_11358 [Marinobacterium stanieri]
MIDQTSTESALEPTSQITVEAHDLHQAERLLKEHFSDEGLDVISIQMTRSWITDTGLVEYVFDVKHYVGPKQARNTFRP